MTPPPLRVVYKVVNGQEIDSAIFLPARRGPEAKYPVGKVINIHGGAFMLGSARTINKDQIEHCLMKGWIVVAPNYRLCPQVSLLEGPMKDCRDLLAWIHSNELEKAVLSFTRTLYRVHLEWVFAFGTSSGGHLALSLGYDVPYPVAGIYDMYGPVNFLDPFWVTEIPSLRAKIPRDLSLQFTNQVYLENPIPIEGGVGPENQAPGPPDFTDPRQAFAYTLLSKGGLWNVICPPGDWPKADPLENITPQFPPTFIVHGQNDDYVPIHLSRDLYATLKKHGVKCGMTEIPEESHSFAARMTVGSRTWSLQCHGFDFFEAIMNEEVK